MTSVLLPIQGRYNSLQLDERYQLRRLIRSFIKWYSYVSQVVRMFDEELHKEFIFLQYLICLLPADIIDDVDLAGKLELEYYKLQKTFEGEIKLENQDGVFEPATANGVTKREEKKPLEEIIEIINERFKGNFSEADRVLLEELKNRLMDNGKLRDLAKTSDPKIFMESIFPGIFGDAAQESYLESQEMYTTLFEDKEKYNAIMMALAAYVYREMNK